MSHVPTNLKNGYYRYLQGMSAHYLDKGMSSDTAKLQMYQDVFDVLYDVVKVEDEVKDHALVASMQYISKHLNRRGYEISQRLETEEDPDLVKQLRLSLRHIKQAKDSVDQFITSFRGEVIDQ